ncbi:MAG: DUF115 domain-containing protein [Parachlamydia sp.]|nr:DUF115 domain-containing protein [Parachlamydia sp.]
MSELFQDNLERFSHMCAVAAVQIQDVDCSHLVFCQTEKGEQNLKRVGGSKEVFYHSQQGAADEAEIWLNEACPLGTKVIFVYGIGLGYYYDALQEWLKRDPGRVIMFLEDDLAVIHCFLETERAARILRDTQVIIQYFPTPGERDWGKFRNQFAWCFFAMASVSMLFEALKLYKEERFAMYQLISNQLRLNFEESKITKIEVIDAQATLYFNFYHNLAWIASSGFAERLIRKFREIPSIICGAGPSLSKQLPLLRTLEGRAIVVGSGSGLNVLNRHGIQPHFGAAIDPTTAQESRFMTNTAFELPIFYAHRFYCEAFTKIHSFRLFTTRGVGFGVQKWFDRELQLPSSDEISGSGISTSNFCEDIACALGNNPIILVGMDLAYTEAARYAAGVTAHPTDDRRQHKDLGKISEQTISAVSVDGKEVQTKWDWVQEAGYFTAFSQNHLDTTVINATEGGLRILEVPHLPLQEVVSRYLKHSYDLDNWIHAEMQQSIEPGLTDEKVLAAMNKWSEKLQACQNLIDKMLKELESAKDKITEPHLTGQYAFLQEELAKEDGYQFYLEELSSCFDAFAGLERKKLEYFPDQFSGERRLHILSHLESARCEFMKRYLEFHQLGIKDGIKAYEERQRNLKEFALPPQERVRIPEVASSTYLFDNNRLIIKDEELDLQEEFHPTRVPEDRKQPRAGYLTSQEGTWEGEALLFYPEGSLKSQLFYKQGKRHGPSTFYSREGRLLARSWFWDDKRIGQSHQYYLDGQLYSLLRYRNGSLDGPQAYYYPDGTLKTLMHFKEGILNGVVRLYYSTGRLKRELHYHAGQLHGKEQYLDETGRLLIEAEYQNGLPMGTSRVWHRNGQLAKEIVFYDNPLNFDLTMWDESGKQVRKQQSLPNKPLDDMIKKSKELMESLEQASEMIEKVKKRENLA